MRIGIEKQVIDFTGLNAELKAALGDAYQGLTVTWGDGGKVFTIVDKDDAPGVFVDLPDDAGKDVRQKAIDAVNAHQAQPYIEAQQAEAEAADAADAEVKANGLADKNLTEILMQHERRLKAIEQALAKLAKTTK